MTLVEKLQPKLTALAKTKAAKRTIAYFMKRGLELSSLLQYYFPQNRHALKISGRILIYLEQYSKAVIPLEKASNISPDSISIWEALSLCYRKVNRPWLQLEAARNAVRVGPATPHRLVRHARIARSMHRYEESAESYDRALRLDPNRTLWQLERADLMRESGRSDAASASYLEIETASNLSAVQRFGIGHLLQKEGRWADAAVEYERRARSVNDAELFYRTAQAFDYAYEWQQSENWYNKAVTEKPSSHWYKRLGFVLERARKLDEAERAYKRSLQLGDTVGVNFRLGYVKSLQSKWQESAFFLLKSFGVNLAYLSSVEDTTHVIPVIENMDTAYLQRAADGAFGRCEWSQTAYIFKLLIDRSDSLNTGYHVKRSTALYLNSEFQEAVRCLLEARVDANHFGMDHAIFKRAHNRKNLEDYTYMRSALALQDRTIVYEAFGGQSMACSPLALFRSLLSDPNYVGWLHVWVLEDAMAVPDDYKNLHNVIFIRKNSFNYLRFLASASHLINNSTFPAWFVRREDQRYLNTWHGTPLKTLGIKMRGRFLEHANGARNFLQATHLIVPNEHTAKTTIEDFGIEGLIEHKLKITGYPRSDLTVSPNSESLTRAREILGLQNGIPVVFYAPTWRGTHKGVNVNIARLRRDLDAMKAKGFQIVYRGHSMEQRELHGLNVDVIIAPPELDTSEILALTDILVTDYSSVFFEFIPLKKPIIFYAFDLEEYSAERGFYLNINDMPGKVVESLDQLLDALEDFTIDETRYAEAAARFCPYDDGNATSRVRDFFFHELPSESECSRKKRTLFYAGPFMANGITASFINLATALSEKGVTGYLGVDVAAIEKDEGRLAAVRAVPNEMQLIGRVGLMPMTPEQRWLVSAALGMKNIPNQNIREIVSNAYLLEFRRVFSFVRFDNAVQFEGYSYFWSILFSSSASTQKIAFLHNDMYQEWYTKNPALEYLFRTYREFDRLVSVSKDLDEHNRGNMSDNFLLPGDKFTSAMNVISPQAIEKNSLEPVDEDLLPWLAGSRTFVAVGRLSSEKDHIKLLNAFCELIQDYPDAKLLIIGDGPLRQMLENFIKVSGLASSIHLAGHRSNAFPAMRAAMALVLPSNHEGQPMVLLEALSLGIKIIATDIPGNRGVLRDRFGFLVHNSIEGLREGMKLCLDDALPEAAVFDADSYRQEAIQEFLKILSQPIDCTVTSQH
ncbi:MULTISPECIES: glycosyltransferase [unclassified Rhizobium]|uniref:glycosyltransferase n=1 Tax=unclassified Rhizobium TaxID=2613769 RepID=UPI000AE64CD1|nr:MULTISPECIES: glycosyltransferase [unclassified Rhizobium]